MKNIADLTEDEEWMIIQRRVEKLMIIFPLIVLSYPFRLCYWKMKDMIKEWLLN